MRKFLRRGWFGVRQWLRRAGLKIARAATLAYLKAQESPEERRARAMFGKRFVGIPEIKTVFGEKLTLPSVPIPFTNEELEKRRETHWLVLDPGTSTKDMVGMTGGGDWEKNGMEPFVFRPEKPTWRLVRVEPPPGAKGLRTWEEQRAVAANLAEEIMGVRALVAVGTLLLYTRNIHLYLGQVRTRDVFQARRTFVDHRVWLTRRASQGVFVLGNPFPIGGSYHASPLDPDESGRRESAVFLEYLPPRASIS